MAETRVQVAYHYKFDPAKEIPGMARLPEMITRTLSVGDEIIPQKVSSESIPEADRAALLIEVEKQVADANRVAKPSGSSAVEVKPADEMSAF